MDKIKRGELIGGMRQLFKFGLVGVLNNMISLIVYYTVIAINRDWYLGGNALGFFISTLNAWYMNSHFVFLSAKKGTRAKRTAFVRTYLTYMVSLGIGTALLYIFVECLGVDERLAPFGCLMLTVPFNFLMNKFWVYKRQTK